MFDDNLSRVRSRLATRVRNLNERGFGRLTSVWGLLVRKLPVHLIPKFQSLLRLLLATDNAFFKRLWNDSELDDSDLKVFKERASMTQNPVYDLVNVPNNRPKFTLVDDISKVLQDMPSDLSLKTIRKFNCGPYALRLAPQYLAHSKELKVYKSNHHGQILFKITGMISRFSKTKTRTVYLTPSTSTLGIIIYCSCKCGTRTVGSCSHGITCIYFFLMKRDSISLPSPGKLFRNVHDISEFSKKQRAAKAGLRAVANVSDTVDRVVDENNSQEGESGDESDDDGGGSHEEDSL